MSLPRILLLAAAVLSPLTGLKAALVYYVPFDSGTNSSLANNGTAGGTATLSTGPFGAPAPVTTGTNVAPNLGSTYSGDFSNSNYGAGNAGGAVSLPNSTTEFRLNSTSSRMTISTWLNVQTLADSGIVNTFPPGTTTGWAMGISGGGALTFAYNATGGGGNRLTAAPAVAAGQWYNVVATWDSSSNDALRFYVDGGLAPLSLNFTGTAVLNTAGEDIALGARSHDPNSTNSGGYNALDGFLDDFAMWDTLLSVAKIKSLNTAPGLLDGYNAGIMDSLFTVYDAASGSQAVDALTWSYATAFDVSGHTLGDTWLSGGTYYLWLGGDGNASPVTGLSTLVIPEPQTAMLLIGAAVALTGLRRVRKVRLTA